MFAAGSPYSPFFTSGLLPLGSDAAPIDDQCDALYFAVQAGRDLDEFRSFLTLELPEPYIPSLRSRSSTSSLRSMPLPKPAPVSDLPEPPRKRTRLPSIDTSCARRPLRSSVAINAPLTAPVDARPFVYRKTSGRSWSTVSTGYKRTKRSDALARLEGRGHHHQQQQRKVRTRILPFHIHVPRSYQGIRNFMSMSDDEDDVDGDNEYDAGDDSADDESFGEDDSSSTDKDSSLAATPLPQTPSTPLIRQQRIPLKSFIDLKERSSSWSSFIHIATVA